MELTPDFLVQLLSVILDALTNVIGTLVGLLPNPDPFPEILDELTIQSNDAVVVAYYWLDSFFIADAVITSLTAWIALFPIAWLIMTLWHWAKVR